MGPSVGDFLDCKYYLEPETSVYKWLFQLDDSKSLHKKWLFHHFHPFKTGCLGYQVPPPCSTPCHELSIAGNFRSRGFLRPDGLYLAGTKVGAS